MLLRDYIMILPGKYLPNNNKDKDFGCCKIKYLRQIRVEFRKANS